MDLQGIIVFVKDVQASLGAITFPVSVHAIKQVIESKYGFEFEQFHSVYWQYEAFAGRLQRFQRGSKKVARIVVSSELNFCWQRFVACKELAHLLIDKESDFVTEPIPF